MLRGLQLRGSTVCGRTIAKDKDADHDQQGNSASSRFMISDNESPPKQQVAKPKLTNSGLLAKPSKRVVRVLDLKDSAKSNEELFLQFKSRLHPWTTIKVSHRKKIYFREICKFEILTAGETVSGLKRFLKIMSAIR